MIKYGGKIWKDGDIAHHIVAFSDTRAAVARAVLEKFNIGLNSSVNGVFLQGAEHRVIHTNAYFEWVNSQLLRAKTQDDVVATLMKIEGQLSWNPEGIGLWR